MRKRKQPPLSVQISIFDWIEESLRKEQAAKKPADVLKKAA